MFSSNFDACHVLHKMFYIDIKVRLIFLFVCEVKAQFDNFALNGKTFPLTFLSRTSNDSMYHVLPRQLFLYATLDLHKLYLYPIDLFS